MHACSLLYKRIVVIGSTLLVPLLGAMYYLPYLPGDIWLARIMQHYIPNTYNWAHSISQLADIPYGALTLSLTLALSFFLTSSWRVMFIALLNFISTLFISTVLKLFIIQPRPSAELIRVSDAFAGSAFPSASAMIFASTFGFLLLLSLCAATPKTLLALVVRWLSIVMLVAMLCARVIVGAHWPSDMLLSYAISFLWSKVLIGAINSYINARYQKCS